MLRHEGVRADPLIFKYKGKWICQCGFIHLLMNIIMWFVLPYIGDSWVSLDASHPFIGFGQLPVNVYNGYGHVMNEEKPLAIRFSADSVSETSVTSVFIINDEKGKPSGSLKNTFGKSGSFNRREEIKNSSQKTMKWKVQTTNGSDMPIENFGLIHWINIVSPFVHPLWFYIEKSFNGCRYSLFESSFEWGT